MLVTTFGCAAAGVFLIVFIWWMTFGWNNTVFLRNQNLTTLTLHVLGLFVVVLQIIVLQSKTYHCWLNRNIVGQIWILNCTYNSRNTVFVLVNRCIIVIWWRWCTCCWLLCWINNLLFLDFRCSIWNKVVVIWWYRTNLILMNSWTTLNNSVVICTGSLTRRGTLFANCWSLKQVAISLGVCWFFWARLRWCCKFRL